MNRIYYIENLSAQSLSNEILSQKSINTLNKKLYVKLYINQN